VREFVPNGVRDFLPDAVFIPFAESLERPLEERNFLRVPKREVLPFRPWGPFVEPEEVDTPSEPRDLPLRGRGRALHDDRNVTEIAAKLLRDTRHPFPHELLECFLSH
jgi:hypothetical protein